MLTQLEDPPATISPHLTLGDPTPRFEAPQRLPPQISPQASPDFKLSDAKSPPSRAPRNLQLRVAGDPSPPKVPRGDLQVRVPQEASPSHSKAPRGDLHVRVAGDGSPSRLWFRRTSGEEESRALAQLLAVQQQQQQQQQQQLLARQSRPPGQPSQSGQPGLPIQTGQLGPPGQPSQLGLMSAAPAAAAGATISTGNYSRCRSVDGIPIGSPSLCSPRLPPRSPRTPDLAQSPVGSSPSSPHRGRAPYSAGGGGSGVGGGHASNRELARRSQQWANLRCEAKVLSNALEELVASTVNDWSVESMEGVAGRSGNIASSSNDECNGNSNNPGSSSPDGTPTELSPKEEVDRNAQRRVE